jgi:hypothetical protein
MYPCSEAKLLISERSSRFIGIHPAIAFNCNVDLGGKFAQQFENLSLTLMDEKNID